MLLVSSVQMIQERLGYAHHLKESKQAEIVPSQKNSESHHNCMQHMSKEVRNNLIDGYFSKITKFLG